VQTIFSYPATLEPDEDGRPVVTFPDLPGAVTDGADQAEALGEASDCLSEALATRIAHGEPIPPPSPVQSGQHVISPDPTIALKAALHMAMYRRDMTVADLAELLGMGDWHQAARLIDPKRSSKLTSLAAALGALGCRIAISISDDAFAPDDYGRINLARWLSVPETAELARRLIEEIEAQPDPAVR
jgi:antitoxin HicB